MLLLVAVLVAALVVFGVAAAATGSGQLSPERADEDPHHLPPPSPVAEDVDALRFGLAFRGYRMAEVDAALEALREALRDRDAELDRLRAAEPDPEPPAEHG